MYEQEILGEVSIPDNVISPRFLLDPVTDSFFCVDSRMNWLVVIDLSANVGPESKKWPPAWPHPDLGDWDGGTEASNNQLDRRPKNP